MHEWYANKCAGGLVKSSIISPFASRGGLNGQLISRTNYFSRFLLSPVSHTPIPDGNALCVGSSFYSFTLKMREVLRFLP